MAVNSLSYVIHTSREEMQRPVRDTPCMHSCFKWSPVNNISITHGGTCSASGGVNSQGTIFTLQIAEEVFHKMKLIRSLVKKKNKHQKIGEESTDLLN